MSELTNQSSPLPAVHSATGRHESPRRLLILALLGLPLWLAGAADVSAAGRAATVQIQNFAFMPAQLSVQPGTTVTWINHDDTPHLVNATDKSFRSSPLDTDARFSFTFTKAGTYSYFCALHPRMTGTILVTAKAK